MHRRHRDRNYRRTARGMTEQFSLSNDCACCGAGACCPTLDPNSRVRVTINWPAGVYPRSLTGASTVLCLRLESVLGYGGWLGSVLICGGGPTNGNGVMRQDFISFAALCRQSGANMVLDLWMFNFPIGLITDTFESWGDLLDNVRVLVPAFSGVGCATIGTQQNTNVTMEYYETVVDGETLTTFFFPSLLSSGHWPPAPLPPGSAVLKETSTLNVRMDILPDGVADCTDPNYRTYQDPTLCIFPCTWMLTASPLRLTLANVSGCACLDGKVMVVQPFFGGLGGNAIFWQHQYDENESAGCTTPAGDRLTILAQSTCGLLVAGQFVPADMDVAVWAGGSVVVNFRFDALSVVSVTLPPDGPLEVVVLAEVIQIASGPAGGYTLNCGLGAQVLMVFTQ